MNGRRSPASGFWAEGDLNIRRGLSSHDLRLAGVYWRGRRWLGHRSARLDLASSVYEFTTVAVIVSTWSPLNESVASSLNAVPTYKAVSWPC